MEIDEAKRKIEAEIRKLSLWIIEQEAALAKAKSHLSFLRGKLDGINEFAYTGESEK